MENYSNNKVLIRKTRKTRKTTEIPEHGYSGFQNTIYRRQTHPWLSRQSRCLCEFSGSKPRFRFPWQNGTIASIFVSGDIVVTQTFPCHSSLISWFTGCKKCQTTAGTSSDLDVLGERMGVALPSHVQGNDDSKFKLIGRSGPLRENFRIIVLFESKPEQWPDGGRWSAVAMWMCWPAYMTWIHSTPEFW